MVPFFELFKEFEIRTWDFKVRQPGQVVDVKQSDIFKNNLAYALELNEIKEETFLQFGMSLQLVVEPVVCTLY